MEEEKVQEEATTVTQEKRKTKTSVVDQIVSSLENLTVLELAELVKALEEKFGVSAAMPMVGPQVQIATGEATSAPQEEINEFTVTLTKTGDKKIQVLKVVREITGLGLKEAKDLVDSIPKPIKEKIPKEEAEMIKAKLVEQGAVVEIK